jgi:hypothetical protein
MSFSYKFIFCGIFFVKLFGILKRNINFAPDFNGKMMIAIQNLSILRSINVVVVVLCREA